MNSNTKPKLLRPRALALTLAVGLFGLAAHAQPKLALVDLRAVFEGYWKSKQARLQVQDDVKDYEAKRKEMYDEYGKSQGEYRKLVDSAADSAISAEERDKRKKSAETKLRDLRSMEQDVKDFETSNERRINEKQRRLNEGIIRDIREKIDRRAKAGSYNLVLDSTALGMLQTPVVLFHSGTPDLSEDVLKDLNEAAPPGALTTPDKDKPEEKKDEKKDEKK
jgi:Skp family chaperone for outer membrane proteins